MAQFNKYDSLIDLSAIKDYCRENGRLCRYAKEETFVQQGTVGKYLGVVESGYFKYTTITSSGNDAVVGFAFEGTIVADYYNSFNGLPSETTIKAGIDVLYHKSASQKHEIYSTLCLTEIFQRLMVCCSAKFIHAILNCTGRHRQKDTLT